MPVIQIIASEPVRYSLNNITPIEFAPGEFYLVPEHAAHGMIRRGWAREATPDEAPGAGEPPPPKSESVSDKSSLGAAVVPSPASEPPAARGDVAQSRGGRRGRNR